MYIILLIRIFPSALAYVQPLNLYLSRRRKRPDAGPHTPGTHLALCLRSLWFALRLVFLDGRVDSGLAPPTGAVSGTVGLVLTDSVGDMELTAEGDILFSE